MLVGGSRAHSQQHREPGRRKEGVKKWRKERDMRASKPSYDRRLPWKLIPAVSPWKVSHMSELKETGSIPCIHAVSVCVCVHECACVRVQA